ncbi:hypothetical protein Dimus_021718 [Dionaea muscipula]
MSMASTCSPQRIFPLMQLAILVLFINACLLLPHRVLCDHHVHADVEDQLLQGLNSFRTAASKVPPLSKHKNAHCLAETVADKFEGRPCSPASTANAIPGTGSPQLAADYPKMLDKCGINATTVREGIILPVCVPKLVPTLVLTNYTHSPYAKYINDSMYTGAGIESEDDWMVVVLATSTQGGSFASAAAAAAATITTTVASKAVVCLVSLALFASS